FGLLFDGTTSGADFKTNGIKLYQSVGADILPNFEDDIPLDDATVVTPIPGVNSFTFNFERTYNPGTEVYFYLTADINASAVAGDDFHVRLPVTSNLIFDFGVNGTKDLTALSAGSTFTIAPTPNVISSTGTAGVGVISDEIAPGSDGNWIFKWDVAIDQQVNIFDLRLPYQGTLLPGDVKAGGAKLYAVTGNDDIPTAGDLIGEGTFGPLEINFAVNEIFGAADMENTIRFWVSLDLVTNALDGKTIQAVPTADDLTFADIVFPTDNLTPGVAIEILTPDAWCDPEPDDPSLITVGPVITYFEVEDDQGTELMSNESGSDMSEYYTNYSGSRELAMLISTTSTVKMVVDAPGQAFVRVWADWNGNGSFTGSDELLFDGAYVPNLTPDTLTFTITAPATITDPNIGATRLRVMTYDQFAKPDGACEVIDTEADGEVEDYGISVIEEQQVTRAYPASEVGYFSFRANWRNQVGESFYRLDVAEDAAFTKKILDNVAVIEDSYVVQNLLYDKNYYYRVRVAYPNGLTGNSNVVKVRTLLDPLTQQDSAALKIIYDQTGGPGWARKENWFVPGVRLTEWEGVTMEGTRVASIDLGGNRLTGKFPASLGTSNALRQLVTLDISNNNLTDLGAIKTIAAQASPKLVNLNYVNNKLDFVDIEPMFNGGVPRIANMKYERQQPIGIYASDTIPRGDNFILTFNTIAADTYQWTRTPQFTATSDSLIVRDSDKHPGPGADFGKTLYTGASTKTMEILDVNFESMGEFAVNMTDNDIPNLVLESQYHNVLAFGGIQLNVSDLNGLPLEEGTGYLLKIEQPGQPFDTLRKDGVPGFPFFDGDLFFDITILGDYVIGVTSDPDVYLPTYFKQTFLWEESDTLRFRNVALQADMAMTPIPGPLDPNDEGVIGGVLELEFSDDESRLDARRRQKGTRCHVRRRTSGGRQDQDDTYVLIASIPTDDNGEFSFPNLPPGTYRINFEYPGVPMDPNSFVEFEVGPPGSDTAEINISALIAESGSIVVEQIIPVGTK
ncbi:MAG: GEVED domain-containing protein, partial [Cyclobacteriaceae bacterium]